RRRVERGERALAREEAIVDRGRRRLVVRGERAPQREREVRVLGAEHGAHALELLLAAGAIAHAPEDRVVAVERAPVGRRLVGAPVRHALLAAPLEGVATGVVEERRALERRLRALVRGARAVEEPLAAARRGVEGVEERERGGRRLGPALVEVRERLDAL